MYETLRGIPLEELERMYADTLDQGRGHQRQAKLVQARASLLKEAVRAAKTQRSQIVISDHAIVRYLERVEGMDIGAIRDKLQGMLVGRVDPKEVHDVITDEDSRTVLIVKNGVVTTVMHADRGVIPERGQLRVLSAIVLLKDGMEWDRARIGDYTERAARQTVEDWKTKILLEEPESEIEVREIWGRDGNVGPGK